MRDECFTLVQIDGTSVDYPLSAAYAILNEERGEWWLGILANTLPGDWAWHLDSDEDDFPNIEIAARIAGPDPAEWIGRQIILPDPLNTRYPSARLYYAGEPETLVRCIVSVGALVRGRIAVRVAGRGSASGCNICVAGEFTLVGGSTKKVETDNSADGRA